MSDQIEQQPVVDAQPPVAAQPDLTAQIEALKAHNAQLIGEKRKVSQTVEDLQKQMADLQSQSQKAKQSKLAEQGEFQQLWKDATETNSRLQGEIESLKGQLQDREAAFQQQQIKATAINAMTQSGVHSPEHLMTQLQKDLRLKDGAVYVLHGGVEIPLGDHLQALKSPGSGFDYFFASSGARGMGVTASTPTATKGAQNPYLSKNLTQIVELEATNPELAARFKSEAAQS